MKTYYIRTSDVQSMVVEDERCWGKETLDFMNENTDWHKKDDEWYLKASLKINYRNKETETIYFEHVDKAKEHADSIAKLMRFSTNETHEIIIE